MKHGLRFQVPEGSRTVVGVFGEDVVVDQVTGSFKLLWRNRWHSARPCGNTVEQCDFLGLSADFSGSPRSSRRESSAWKWTWLIEQHIICVGLRVCLAARVFRSCAVSSIDGEHAERWLRQRSSSSVVSHLHSGSENGAYLRVIVGGPWTVILGFEASALGYLTGHSPVLTWSEGKCAQHVVVLAKRQHAVV